ncbi:hypothetical protein LXA43DRAFT_905897, partial [Ganoderma leucocontextum]
VVITSENLLQEFVEAARDDRHLGQSVQELTVRVRNPVSLGTLHQSLAVVPFITDLVLCLSPGTPADLLDDLRFPRLQLFKTNLPHNHLVRFVSAHRSLTDLCLDVCGHEACPLHILDLRHIATIEGPVDCVPGVAQAGLLHLTAYSQRHSLDTSTILISLKTPLQSLVALTLDVRANDYGILQSIIHCAPMVEKLKLLERPPSIQRRQVHARRAWNDAKSWSSCLGRLERLEDFALRTSSALIRSPTVGNEQKKFVRWATRVSRASSTTVGRHAHPTLTSLRIWYRICEPGGGILSYWSKSSGEWRNIARRTDPTFDIPF